MAFDGTFTKIASTVARAAGMRGAFIACCIIIAIWGLTGSLFSFSDTWQLIINTGTTNVTFLMVFPDPEHVEPGRRGSSGQARRAHPGDIGVQQAHWHRAPDGAGGRVQGA
jgi:hypothetical protein